MQEKTQREYKRHPDEGARIERLFVESMQRVSITLEEKTLVPTGLIDGASRIFYWCGKVLEAAEEGNYLKRRLFGLMSLCFLYYTEVLEKGSDPRFLLEAAVAEAEEARSKFPWWPVNDCFATVIIAEEGGELLKAANEVFWSQKQSTTDDVYKELVQTVAMCVRLYTESIWVSE